MYVIDIVIGRYLTFINKYKKTERHLFVIKINVYNKIGLILSVKCIQYLFII